MFETGTNAGSVDPFAGPVHHGTDVAVDLELETRTGRRATLLRPDGQACANEEIVLDPLTNARKVTTDDAGGITFWATRKDVTFAASRLRAQATLTVPDPPENGTPDLASCGCCRRYCSPRAVSSRPRRDGRCASVSMRP
jgi:hypothetical protein